MPQCKEIVPCASLIRQLCPGGRRGHKAAQALADDAGQEPAGAAAARDAAKHARQAIPVGQPGSCPAAGGGRRAQSLR